jgi:lipoprotein NlpD
MRCLLLLMAVLAITACAPRTSVRVDPVSQPRPVATPAQSVPAAGQYVVVRGDTLYGIAFRHGLDYRQLAQLNQIGPPFTIYPGQRLQLGAAPAATAERAPAAGRTPRPAGAGARVAAPLASQPPAATTAPPPSGAVAAVTAPPPAAPAAVSAGPMRWRWPAEGPLAGTFVANDPTRQGVSIVGSAGQPVFAAADGVVVYSGSGLIGYGELIIIKHSDEWLSAYGHNRKRLAEEGARVTGGQQIAEMGRSGASRDMLHFEIRRNGRPVDPVSLLPRR